MAGDWIKWVKGLIRRPEIIQAAGILKRCRHDVASRWMDLMEWTDENVSESDRIPDSDDALVKNLTPEIIDDLVGLPEFARAMSCTGWLVLNPDDVTITNYFRHNDETAKDRALGAKRAAKKRDRDAERYESNAPSVTPSVTREEQQRAREEQRQKTAKQDPSVPVGGVGPDSGGVAAGVSARSFCSMLLLAGIPGMKSTTAAAVGKIARSEAQVAWAIERTKTAMTDHTAKNPVGYLRSLVANEDPPPGWVVQYNRRRLGIDGARDAVREMDVNKTMTGGAQ